MSVEVGQRILVGGREALAHNYMDAVGLEAEVVEVRKSFAIVQVTNKKFIQQWRRIWAISLCDVVPFTKAELGKRVLERMDD